ncbi:hypothetical protein SAMN04487764_2771 [Gillisia sp. Hel1_33_143]|uniref:hypothetical protein n=1 Tax=Gillisia sp. Hel1_33_143 TaxID=1336796 RepID=UPI00087BA365|nr:hypothetical protein [Gillisia sp. Hel1_33_143]SDS67373.1 hypothetical protein SAMN04487764_2771 [Gillisia sp. Hel1_33_143]
MKETISILVLLITNLTFAQIDKSNDSLEIWTVFSTGNFINQNAEKIVEKNWPFKIKGIAGDTFSENLIDSLEVHNNNIWNHLDSNGFSNSKEKFESDLLEEIEQIKKAVEISQSDKIVSDLYERLRERNLQNYTELSKKNQYKYVFKVYSFDLDNLESEQVFELKFITDLKKKQTTILNKKTTHNNGYHK